MHTCHATGCTKTVPPAMFMCRTHWYSLPKRLRDQIWVTYRAGQEDDKEPSAAYCDAAIACVTFIAQREGKVPDVRLYEIFRPEGA
jgi:hypothetical protein